MSRKWIVRTAVAAVLVLAALVALSACGGGDGDDGDDGDDVSISGVAEVTERFQGLPQSGKTVGQESAAVEIVEYGDLQCPFCASASETLTPQILDQMVRPGDARLTFGPVAFIGEGSEIGALAAESAAKQDRAWNLVEIIYANQGEEAREGGWLSEEFAREAAAAAGLDLAQYDADFDDEKTARAVFESEIQFQEDGGTGTPFYVVRGPGGERTFSGIPDVGELIQAVRDVG